MKNYKQLLFVLAFILSTVFLKAQVKIGDNPNSINASSLLELESSSKGFLAPRMTQANRLAIASPVQGLLIYQTDGTQGFYMYTGSAWTSLAQGTGSQWSTNGSSVYYNTGNTGIGTSSPTALLNIKSTSPNTGGICLARFEGIQTAGGSNNVHIQLANNSTTSSKTFMLLGGISYNSWAVGNDLYGANVQNFYIFDLNTYTTRFLIDAAGKAGIGTDAPNSLLQVAGSISLPITTQTVNYTATTSDHTILCNTASMTVTLPAASGVTGRIYVVKKVASAAGSVTIDPNGSETIDGAITNTSITSQHQSLTIQSDGSSWYILSKN